MPHYEHVSTLWIYELSSKRKLCVVVMDCQFFGYKRRFVGSALDTFERNFIHFLCDLLHIQLVVKLLPSVRMEDACEKNSISRG